MSPGRDVCGYRHAVTSTRAAVRTGWAAPLNAVRGALIGAAEVVPGVSGGTVALVVGVYTELITSAGHLVSAVRLLLLGRREEARREHAHVQWSVLLPLLAGMAVAVVVGAAVLEPVLEEHPVGSRAVFAGMILASLSVPIQMVRRWGAREVVVAVVAAVAAALLTGLPPGTVSNPPLPVVSVAAALAVCALVLPGVSGSFLLLTLGLYAPTLAAVNDRDLAYLGAFVAGAVVGLSAFVKVLQYLLGHHPSVTLAVMTGLMAGSLRALWPWQGPDRELYAPGPDLWPVLGLVLLGAVGLLTLVAAERRLAPAKTPTQHPPTR